MTEQEYIDRGDLVTVCHTLNLLRQIEPRNSSVITPREYKQVMKTLVGWQDHLYAIQLIDIDISRQNDPLADNPNAPPFPGG